jgi:hypothetical protein
VSGAGVALERVAVVIAALALAIGLIAVLSGFFAGRDQAGVGGSSSPPGQAYRDLGHRHLPPSRPDPAYDSDPPTSGPHHVVAIRRDRVALDDDQLLQALEVGDVVIFYGQRTPPAGVGTLARKLAPRFSPALASSGQAVVLAPRPGVRGLVAVAWDHILRAPSASDPALRAFVSFWLGRGAPSRCC